MEEDLLEAALSSFTEGGPSSCTPAELTGLLEAYPSVVLHRLRDPDCYFDDVRFHLVALHFPRAAFDAAPSKMMDLAPALTLSLEPLPLTADQLETVVASLDSSTALALAWEFMDKKQFANLVKADPRSAIYEASRRLSDEQFEDCAAADPWAALMYEPGRLTDLQFKRAAAKETSLAARQDPARFARLVTHPS